VRRAVLVGLATLALTGTANGAIKGSGSPNTIRGGAGDDVLYGYGGKDRIEGRGGDDLLNGGTGIDVLVAGPGNDRVTSVDGGPDIVECGPGRDVVTADLEDDLTGCETVSRRLSNDPYRGTGAQPGTEVEPDSFAYGRTIVTAFQVSRFVDGGAANLGFATSRDGGANWVTGMLPGLTVFSTPAGTLDLVSDPVVAYDRVHRTWLVAAVGADFGGTVLTVSRSRDGVTWNRPVVAARQSDGDYDKEWITCDNWRASRFAGRCYLSYLDFERSAVMTRHSLDGGKTWSAASGWSLPPRIENIANGVQPVVRPNGQLVVPFAVFQTSGGSLNEIAVLRSVDGGVTFVPPLQAAVLTALEIYQLRAPPLPSVAIDRAGTIYLTWSDCRFVSGCGANGLVLTKSRDGIGWTEPGRIPVGGRGSTVTHFLPGLSVRGSGGRAHIAVAYYSATQPIGCNYSCDSVIDAWMSFSHDGGKSWHAPRRLTSEVVRSNWLADTGLGRMLGDYISTSWVQRKPIAVLPLASPPVRGRFREQIFATTRLK
jgi:hypothetical protein